jgi:potassium efflux system protein
VGVSYNADPAQVIALLIATAAQTKGVVKRPEPTAFFIAFGDSALQFSLRAWTFDFDNWYAIRSDLATRVHDALAQAGIEVPFPQRDLHVRSVSPEVGDAFGRPASTPQPPSPSPRPPELGADAGPA